MAAAGGVLGIRVFMVASLTMFGLCPGRLSRVEAQQRQGAGTPQFVETLRIPRSEAAGEVAFHIPAGAVPGPDRTIFVFDRFEQSVRVFSRNGALLRSFGRQGKGPGEFMEPSGLYVYKDRVYAADHKNRRLSWFSLAGVYQGDRAYPRRDSTRMELPARVIPLRYDHLLLEVGATSGDISGKKDIGNSRVLLYRPATTVPQVVAEYSSGLAFALQANLSYAVGVDAFGPGGLVAAFGDSIVALVDTYRGSIRYMLVTEEELRPLRVRNLNWQPQQVIVSRADEDRYRSMYLSRVMGSNAPAVRISSPTFRGPAWRAIFASTGDLWLSRRLPPGSLAESSALTWHVVPWDPKVEPYDVVLPVGFILFSVAGSELIGFHLDADRVPTLRVYQFTRR